MRVLLGQIAGLGQSPAGAIWMIFLDWVMPSWGALVKYPAVSAERQPRTGLDLGVYRVDDGAWTSQAPKEVRACRPTCR